MRLKSRPAAADPDLVARQIEVVAPSGSNRRTSTRIDLEIEVGLTTDSNFYTGLTQDISTGGIFVATHHIRHIGDRVVVQFSLPGWASPVVVDAEVRWVREVSALYGSDSHTHTGMGLKFLGLSPEARVAIASFLKKRESLYYDDE